MICARKIFLQFTILEIIIAKPKVLYFEKEYSNKNGALTSFEKYF